MLLTKDVALAEGLLALALLIGLQWIVAWLSVRSAKWRGLVKRESRLIALRGALIESAMRQERITEADIHAAVRSQGSSSLNSVEAVGFETDGSVSVITKASPQSDHAALPHVRGFPQESKVGCPRRVRASRQPHKCCGPTIGKPLLALALRATIHLVDASLPRHLALACGPTFRADRRGRPRSLRFYREEQASV